MTTRRIEPVAIRDTTPGVPPTAPPVFANCDPRDLMVDEEYQRGLSERSLRMIRKIIMGWDWRKFKPPVVAQVDGEYHVIDGQHTAIAAATHGGLGEIPVMVIDASDIAARAASFVGHNRDRLAVTAAQVFYAGVAAGNEDAVNIAQTCERAGITILKMPPMGNPGAKAKYAIGDTQAVKTVETLVRRRFPLGARKVLEILVQARMAPVTANQIKAVELLLFDDEYKKEVQPEKLIKVLVDLGDIILERDGALFAAGHNVPLWRAMAIVLFRKATYGQRKVL